MAKAEQLRERFPTLSIEQAFEKVYCDSKNSALTQAERRGNGPYDNSCQLEDATAVAKAALEALAPKPGVARMEPDDLGSNYSNGPSMTPGMDAGFPSADEILRLVNAERRKGGVSREKAFDKVAAKLLKAEQDYSESRENETGALNL
jgi:hypothetical protein